MLVAGTAVIVVMTVRVVMVVIMRVIVRLRGG